MIDNTAIDNNLFLKNKKNKLFHIEKTIIINDKSFITSKEFNH
jgi:hypothetical protein